LPDDEHEERGAPAACQRLHSWDGLGMRG
jgi:hypothetical protein